MNWIDGRKDDSRLLRGKSLGEAEEQLATNSGKDPAPTDLQRLFILASRKSTENLSRRLTLIPMIVVFIIIIMGGYILYLSQKLAAIQAGQKTPISSLFRFRTCETS